MHLSEITESDTRSTPTDIRVLLADDQSIVRFGLRKLLDREGLIVVGEAADSREVLPRVQELHPDVLLLDQGMLHVDGSATLPMVQVASRQTKVIVTAATQDRDEFVEVMRMGARGLILKQSEPESIVKSIQKVHNGEIWLDSQTIADVLMRFSAGPPVHSRGGDRGLERKDVSKREAEIIALVARGYKNKEMAELMFISEQTVKNHLHSIFQKLQVADRLELALYAVHSGLYATEVPSKVPPQKSETTGGQPSLARGAANSQL